MSRLAERYRSARRPGRLVLLEGFHALKHALRFGAEVVDARASDPEALLGLAEELAPDLGERLRSLVRPVGADGLEALVPRVPSTGVVALARRPAVDPRVVLAEAAEAPVVLLERPSHLGNLGAVVRVCAAAGAAGLLSTGPHDPWHPDAVRGAAGLQFACPVARLDAPNGLRGSGGDRLVVGLDPEGDPWSEPLPRRSLLAFGSERQGLSGELLERCDRRIALPMRTGVSSLNLATSVAAVLYVLGTGGPAKGAPFEARRDET